MIAETGEPERPLRATGREQQEVLARKPAFDRDARHDPNIEHSRDEEMDLLKSSYEVDLMVRLSQLSETRGRWWSRFMAAVAKRFRGNGPTDLQEFDDLGEADDTDEVKRAREQKTDFR